jgi:hypothetical protein
MDIFKEYKIYPHSILYSRTNIKNFTENKYSFINLSRDQVHLFKFPNLIYDRKDRFKQKQLKNVVDLNQQHDSKIKGRVFILEMEEFLKNIQINPSTYHVFLQNLGITKILLLSNQIFNEESNYLLLFNSK